MESGESDGPQARLAGLEPRSASRETIAGHSATCLHLGHLPGAGLRGRGEITMCLDDEPGVTLRSVAAPGDTHPTTLEALELGELDPELFAPPAKPQQPSE